MNTEAVRAWLEARYGDDERVANACRHKVWTQDGGSIIAGHPTEEVVDWVYDEGGWEHIALHDPARALVEVAAKRRRLERHAPSMRGAAGRPWCTSCSTPWEWRNRSGHTLTVDWPCPDIIDDAQAYRSEPGFPAELRLP